jgi:membrane protease YdiL (CAAX protease family)
VNEHQNHHERYHLLLMILTGIVTFLIGVELLGSWSQPKAQSQLNLYQSDLLLQASEWQSISTAENPSKPLPNPLLEANPIPTALKNYQQVRTSVQTDLDRLEQAESATVSADTPTAAQSSQKQDRSQFRDELDLLIGLLLAQSNQTEAAIATWTALTSKGANNVQTETAQVLKGLWSDPPQLLPKSQQQLQTHLKGWFQDQALERLYTLAQRQEDLTQLKVNQQVSASHALVRVTTINGLTLVGNGLGLMILLVWLIRAGLRWYQGNFVNPSLQRVTPQPLPELQALADVNSHNPTVTPAKDPGSSPTQTVAEADVYLFQTGLAKSVLWPVETIWQVMVFWFLAFFAISLTIPLLLYALRVQPTVLGARAQAYFAFLNYATLVVVGISIVICSLKGFLSTPWRWFRIRWQGRWVLWGMGGYFVALPLVILIALLNQKLLGDQGGGNPLLELIIQSHDPVTAGLLFVMVAGLAPFFEEILFRGFFLTSLTRYLPLWGAIGVSGLVFAVAHLNLADILPLTVLGFVLGFVYTRSRNLLSSMLLHSLWNSGSFLSLLILGSSTR